MRRLLSLALALFFLCCAVPTALAASVKTYDLPELNLTIDAPEGWYAFTQDVKEDDPDLKLLGIDGKGRADQYKENGIYLDMRSAENNDRIKVEMSDSDDPFVYDYNDMSDEELQLWAYEMQNQTYTFCSVYTHKQAKFAVFNYSDLNNGKMIYGKTYLTVINGQEISIMLLSINEISGSLEQTIQDTVDSITFTKVTSNPVPEAAALDATYELPELNMTMRSPKDWYVFTQAVDKDDPDFKHYIRTYGERIADFYERKGSCLYMISPDDHAEIYVTQCSQSIHDFNDLSDKDLLLLASKIWDMHGRLAVYKHKQAKFVLDYTGLFIRCLTVIKGQAISVNMGSLGTVELSDNLAPMLINVVDSITFTNAMPEPVSEKVTYELTDTIFADLNMTIDASGNWYVSDYGIGLKMLSTDPDAEIKVDMTNSDVRNFADMTDEDLLQSAAIKQEMERYKPSEGNIEKAAYSDYSVYAQKQTKFVTCDFTQLKDSKTVYGKKYFTVTDWGAIEVTLYSNEGEVSDNLEQALKSMVNSITFKKAPEQADGSVVVYASLAGAMLGAIIGTAVLTIRKRRMAY